MEPELRPGERIDDLQRNGYRIIQNPDRFCFGMDAVLLSAFARAGAGEQVLDMCSGTGIVPILMCARYPKAHYRALEILPEMAEMAGRSVQMNGLGDHIEIITGDVKNASGITGAGIFDLVTVNPPYMNENHGLVNPDDARAIARHEILCSLEDVVSQAALVLKSGGRFYMVHRPHRLAEIISVMRRYRLEPKRLRMVHPRADAEAKMVLIEGVRSGGTWLKVEKPLIIYGSEGKYTEEVYSIYEG